jgi:hypothetical protein
MRLLKLSMSVGSRSRHGGRRLVSGRLLYVALLMLEHSPFDISPLTQIEQAELTVRPIYLMISGC